MIDNALLSIAEKIHILSKSKKIKISTVESCTGGLIAACITSISGASNIFNYGFVTYSDEAKINLLSINEQIINNYGVISKYTAKAMAQRCLHISQSDIAISVTGIASPCTQYHQDDIGLMYFGLASHKDVKVHEIQFKGNRQEIRYSACKHVLETILTKLSIYKNL